MRILMKTLSIALAVTIPITSLCLGINIATRMPDVYQYEFKAADVLHNLDLEKDNDQMGKFISDFMIGKTAEWQIITEDEDRTQRSFNENEMMAAATARKDINIVAAIGILALILMVTSFVMLKKYDFNKEIRKRFKLGAVIYVCLIAVYIAGFLIAAKTGHSLGDMLGYKPHEDDLLPQIITGELQRGLLYSSAVVSAVIMGIFGYIIYKITEPKRIFSRNYY